jgi:hypothetical protein
MKACFKCGETKALSEFYRHKMMADGHLNKCKDCAKMDVRKHRSENESVREYDRRRYYENPERRKHASDNAKKWNEKYPERYRAHYAVSNAVRDGRLKKMPCEVCGDDQVHAHHEDYSNPLDVVWLCPRHHALHHAEE